MSVCGGVHSGKLTWQWKIPIFNREYIFKGSIFHCYVSFRGVYIAWLENSGSFGFVIQAPTLTKVGFGSQEI